MRKPIYGNLICQNAISEIRRCIESVAPLVDEYFICDGGSTDGTWELLNEWKDIYNLTLFQNPYKDQGEQRNFLLDKTPKDAWILNLDQDERLNSAMAMELRMFIDMIDPELYTTPERELVFTISITNINLVKDLVHYDSNNINIFATKLFYNDRNLHFTPGYHTTICYEDEKRMISNSLPAPKRWVIKHYAYLDPVRIKTSSKNKKRVYTGEEWNEKNWNPTDLPLIWL